MSVPSDTDADREPARPAATPSTLKTCAQLVRLPAVFTALADIILGYMLTHRAIGDSPLQLVLLLTTSACLYLAGMVLNDVFDARLDAVERPERPIPSGRVSRSKASLLAVALIVIGLGTAASLRWLEPIFCGWNPLLVAGGIVLAVLLYNGLLKSTPLGPISMGLCRFLNVILGASASGFLLGKPFYDPQRWIAIGLAVYVAGVTWFARSEAGPSSRKLLSWGLFVVNLGLTILIGWVWKRGPAETQWLAFALLAVIALNLNKRMLVAISQPSPTVVQSAVRTLLLSIITLDCAVIFAKTGNILVATSIAVGLIVPAMLTGRWIRMT
ncbi:MAG: UbiA family prenyltransferase [Planctomycetaceae bacterium]